MNRLLEQMRELTQLRGVSGREEGVREYLIRSIEGHCDEYKVDPMGNLIVYKMGKKAGAKRVLIINGSPQRGEELAALLRLRLLKEE